MAEDLIGQALGNIGTPDYSAFMNIAGVMVLVVVGAVFLAVSGYLIITKYKDKQRYDTVVHIYYQEKGSKIPIFRKDIGGIYLDTKIKMKRFFLKGNRVGLDPDNVPFIYGPKGQKIVTLWQMGLKNFRYCSMDMNPTHKFNISVGEEDVNWAIASYSEWKNKFKFENFLQQYGHIMLWSVTVVGTLILMYFVTEKFDVLPSVAQSLETAALAVRDSQAGTIIK